MTEQQNLFENEFDRLYASEYRQGEGHCGPTNPENRFDEVSDSVSTTAKAADTAVSESAKELAEQVKPKDLDEEQLKWLGYNVLDFVNTMYPEGPSIRHRAALKLYYDFLILFDGDPERAKRALLAISWVQDIITERGMSEIERIVDAGRKLLHKRESENFNDPQPSKEMRRAIEQVCSRKYSLLVREQRSKLVGQSLSADDEVLQLLNRIGERLQKKFFKHFELLRLVCHRLKRKHYIAGLYVGGCLGATLMTRMYYKLFTAPGRDLRINTIVELIGRTGSGKSLAIVLYRIMMEPIKAADAAQIEALNRYNEEREMKNGAEKSKLPRPRGVMRCIPSEASAAAIREAEFNAKEIIDGVEFPLHVFQQNSELDDVLAQQKKSYMNIEQLFYKSLGNEPAGSFLKTSSSMVGEYDVHYNALFSGTPSAMSRQITPTTFAKGLPQRLGIVPMGDSNFEIIENHEYDDADRQRDNRLREFSYFLDATKGEIPIKAISDALHAWNARIMQDAKDEQSKALEDLVKRPILVALNLALPYIVSRHMDQMVEDGGKYKCGPNFAVDKIDIDFVLAVCDAQFAFQQLFALPVGEKLYDDLATEQASNVRHQQKTLLAFRRLPNPCCTEDIDREYGYDGNKNSINSRIKRLQDEGLLEKIRSGEDKGMYRKLA